MLLAKVAAPAAAYWKNWPPLYEQALNNNLTIFITQPGYFWSDGLMAMLNEHSRSACWLRLEPEDGDPAGLLLSLIAAAQRISPEAGVQTLVDMHQSPGPAAGWEPLFAHLGQELVESLPGNSVLIIEHLHQIAGTGHTIRLLLSSFLPWLSRRFPSILTSEKPISLGGWPEAFVEHHLEDLRLDFRFASALFKDKCSAIDEDAIWTALHTIDGKATGLAALCTCGEFLDSQFIKTTILENRNPGRLFNQLSQAIMSTALPGTTQALAVTNQISYMHPELVSAALGNSVPISGPWLQPLSDGWRRVYQVWNGSLRDQLQVPVDLLHRAVLHAADYLYAQGAAIWAIRTYFDCGALGSAARGVAGAVDHFLDLGLWQTLDKWLKRLPREILEEWPSLVYALGEVEALNGNLHNARIAFTNAGQLFANRQDMDGFCQSKLAESALAIQQDDRDQAWSSALTASALAARFGLKRQGNWANWQLGRLAAASDQLDDALSFFSQVSKDDHDRT